MNKTFTFLAVAALTASSTLVFAQSPKASFADTFADMQALSSNSSQWQPPQPVVSRQAAGPRDRVALRDYQALSSNSSQWQIDQGTIAIDSGPTFAQAHPHGIAFAEYQALASNSGEFQLSGNADASSYASTATPQAAMGARPTLRDRWARLFRHDEAPTRTD
ncbi:MAG TPA: hypothetical protein VGN65_11895 [Casimicrobiaceae bacterium]|jgi:hypothetical protein